MKRKEACSTVNDSKKVKVDQAAECEFEMERAIGNLAKFKISEGGQVSVITSLFGGLRLRQSDCGVPVSSVTTPSVVEPNNDLTPPPLVPSLS